jgi:hypothetical protein
MNDPGAVSCRKLSQRFGPAGCPVVRAAAFDRCGGSEMGMNGRRMPLMPSAKSPDKEARIYTMVVGTWMVILLGFGVLTLTGMLR